MKSLKCPSCGAPVDLEAGSVAGRCTFCGATFAPTQQLDFGRKASSRRQPGKEIAVEVVVGSTRQAIAPGRALGCSALVFALIFGVGAFVWLRAQKIERSVRAAIATSTKSLTSATRGPATAAESAWPVARLAEPSFSGEHVLAAAAPPTGFAAFEPVASLPWALSIAQVWSRDVKLERIDVDRLRPDGTVNVQDDPEAEVTYRFVSPSRFQSFRERANLEKDPRGDQEFWVEVAGGKVSGFELSTLSAFADDDAAEDLARLNWPKSLPLTRIVPALAERKGFPAVPFFEGYLIQLDDEGWCWYLSTLSGSPDIPRVRARDGRVWPYGG